MDKTKTVSVPDLATQLADEVYGDCGGISLSREKFRECLLRMGHAARGVDVILPANRDALIERACNEDKGEPITAGYFGPDGTGCANGTIASPIL